jgi:hypothetical protein
MVNFAMFISPDARHLPNQKLHGHLLICFSVVFALFLGKFHIVSTSTTYLLYYFSVCFGLSTYGNIHYGTYQKLPVQLVCFFEVSVGSDMVIFG